MKAIQVKSPGQIDLVDKPVPEISSPGEVLVKVKAVGICGSDLHIYHGTSPVATYPRVLGHEVAGEVVAAGSGVNDLSAGNRVVLEPIEYCGTCYACRQGRGNVCQELRVQGVHIDGGFQEYICVSEEKLHKIPADISFNRAVMIEPYTIGYQANWRGGVLSGDLVLIYGAGPTGLVVLDRAKMLGATCIVADIREDRLETARSFGADYVINSGQTSPAEFVRKISDGRGANVVFDAVGLPAILAEAVRIASVAGRVVSMGFTNDPADVPLLEITRKELTISGTRLQTQKFAEVIQDFPLFLDHVDKMISHVMPYADFRQAFTLLEDINEKTGKIVLTFGD